MALHTRRFSWLFVVRVVLIVLGCLAFVAVGYVSPTSTQWEMFDQYWTVYLFGAVLILLGLFGMED